MQAVDAILEAMRNGEWHRVKEIAQQTAMSESKVKLVSDFLNTYDFVEFDRKNGKARLTAQFKLFLERVHEVESGETGRKRRTSIMGLHSF